MRVKNRKRIRSRKHECGEVKVDDSSFVCKRGTQTEPLNGKIKIKQDTEVHLHNGQQQSCEVVVGDQEEVRCRHGRIAYRWDDFPTPAVQRITEVRFQ